MPLDVPGHVRSELKVLTCFPCFVTFVCFLQMPVSQVLSMVRPGGSIDVIVC